MVSEFNKSAPSLETGKISISPDLVWLELTIVDNESPEIGEWKRCEGYSYQSSITSLKYHLSREV